MTAIAAGIRAGRLPGAKYAASLPFVELDLGRHAPRASTIRRWRAGMPEGFTTALVAPREAVVASRSGAFRMDEGVEAALAWLQGACAAAAAAFVVVPTYGEMTPGQRDRDLLAVYVERLRKWNQRIVWAPSGPWEADASLALAKRLGVLCAYDPLDNAVPAPDIGYARLQAAGARARISAGMLSRVAETTLASGATRAYVAIDGADAFHWAVQLQRLTAADADASVEDIPLRPGDESPGR